jgi:hypothetical protein
VATINSGNSTTLYSTTQTTTSVSTATNLPSPQVNETNFTTLYSNSSAAATGGGTSGNLLVSGNLRVLGTSDLEGAVTIGNSYILPTSDGTNGQVVVTDGSGNLTFQNVSSISSYAIQADTVAGGADLTLVGLSTTDSVKFASGTNMNIVRTDASTITVNTITTPVFDGGTFGNITVGVVTDNTISTTTGGLILDSTSGATNINTNVYINGIVEVGGDYLKINADSTANDSYLYLKGSSVAIKYNNTTDFIDMPRTAINNILLNTNTISTTTGGLILDSDSTAVNVSHDLYVSEILEVSGDYIKINAADNATDSYLYMKGTTQYLKWDVANQLFVFSNSIFSNIDIIAGANLATNGNNIYFNYDDVSAADSYLTVKRGAAVDVSVRWNEATNKWQFTNDGTNYYDMVVNIDDLADVVITPPVGAGQFLVSDGTNWINNSTVNFTSTTYRPNFQADTGVYGRTAAGAVVSNNTGAVNYTTGDGGSMLMGIDSDAQSFIQIGSISTAYDTGGDHQLRLSTSTSSFTQDQATSITGSDTLVFASVHGFSIGNKLSYSSPTQNGLTYGTTYYVIATGFTTTQCQVSLTSGGSAVTLTNGTGLSLWFSNNTSRLITATTAGVELFAPTILLNAVNTGIAGVDASLEVERGTSGSNVEILWNETTDRWTTTTDGSTYLNIPNQNLDTTDSVTFSNVVIDSQATIDSSTLTTTSTATVALNATARNAMTGLVNIVQGANVHCVNYTALRIDATTAMLTTFGEMYNTSALANFTADVSGGNIRLLVTPTSATSTVFSAVRTSLT